MVLQWKNSTESYSAASPKLENCPRAILHHVAVSCRKSHTMLQPGLYHGITLEGLKDPCALASRRNIPHFKYITLFYNMSTPQGSEQMWLFYCLQNEKNIHRRVSNTEPIHVGLEQSSRGCVLHPFSSCAGQNQLYLSHDGHEIISISKGLFI